ncbi:WS/DGAT/MGAT family O-acyltransferase [Marinobacter sp. GN3S48]|uniref:WS/DGAT/MGAT family O-acyltransferase n=1 Tax=Marinobacter sp. GN3S48 TaxID=3382302 RepID=UPI00387B167A
MKRLSSHDAGFLYAERSNMPMHVGGLHLYNYPEGADQDWLREQLTLSTAPVVYPFNQKLHWPLSRGGLPHWVEEDDIDLEYHIRHYSVPKPGRYREMFALVSSLHSTPTHRDRPLWEAHIMEGVDKNRFAIYFKLHHALADGGAAVKILQNSLSEDPEKRGMLPPWANPMPRRAKAKSAGGSSLVALSAVAEQVQTQVGAIPGVLKGLKKYYDGIRRGELDGIVAPFQAPASMLNQRISQSRRFVAQAYSLTRIKTLAKQYDATLNDIVMAITASALRRYLLEHNALPEQALTALVPVSVRPADSDDYGNAVSLVIASLATNELDPIERLRKIQRSMKEGKELVASMTQSEIMLYSTLMSLPIGLPMLLGMSSQTLRPPFNVTISNVPGPRKPLYWNGAELQGHYPVSIVTNGVALNITVTSYVDQMEFGIVACRKTVPGMQRLIDYLDEALMELEAGAGKG